MEFPIIFYINLLILIIKADFIIKIFNIFIVLVPLLHQDPWNLWNFQNF